MDLCNNAFNSFTCSQIKLQEKFTILEMNTVHTFLDTTLQMLSCGNHLRHSQHASLHKCWDLKYYYCWKDSLWFPLFCHQIGGFRSDNPYIKTSSRLQFTNLLCILPYLSVWCKESTACKSWDTSLLRMSDFHKRQRLLRTLRYPPCQNTSEDPRECIFCRSWHTSRHRSDSCKRQDWDTTLN